MGNSTKWSRDNCLNGIKYFKLNAENKKIYNFLDENKSKPILRSNDEELKISENQDNFHYNVNTDTKTWRDWTDESLEKL